jgi:hypothetical protein
MVCAHSDDGNSPSRNGFIVDALQERGGSVSCGYWDTEWTVGGMNCHPFEGEDFSVGHSVHADSAAHATWEGASGGSFLRCTAAELWALHSPPFVAELWEKLALFFHQVGCRDVALLLIKWMHKNVKISEYVRPTWYFWWTQRRVCMCAYVCYTASVDRLELNHELGGMQNKAVVVCCGSLS